LKLRVSNTQTTKQKFSSTLRGWLPILQANLDGLVESLEPFVHENPFISVTPGSERDDKRFEKKNFFQTLSKNSVTSAIEALTLDKKSLFQTLHEQVNPPLFPTIKSQTIAYEIIEHINSEGYFESEMTPHIAQKLCVEEKEVEKIRQRFAYLDPIGVGALDLKESFLFQLGDMEVEESLYPLVETLILHFEAIESYNKEPRFLEALSVIKKFRNPPGVDFLEDEKEVIPDIFIYQREGSIEVHLNDAYYTEIIIDTEGVDENHTFVSQKIKEAKDLVDALEMR